MHYYLFRPVDRTPSDDDPLRNPAPPTFQQEWTTLRFVPNPRKPFDGFGVLAVSQRDGDAERAPGCRYLGDNLDDEVGGRLLMAEAGLNFKGRGTQRIRECLLDLFVNHSTKPGNTTRWNGLTPMMPERRGERARYEVWLGNEPVVSLPVVGGGAGPFTESFNKANSSNLGPNQTWNEDGNLQVLSNVCDVVTTSNDLFARVTSNTCTTDNNYAQGVITGTDTTSTTSWGVQCRNDVGSTSYVGRQGDISSVNASQIMSYLNGITYSALASSTHTKADGDVIKVRINGNAITLSFNGTDNLTTTDSSWATGKTCGVVLRAAATGRAKLDSFEFGDISTPSAPALRRTRR